jgi:hypothetical protein
MLKQILLFVGLAFACPAAAKDYLVTPANMAAVFSRLASGDTVMVDPSVASDTLLPTANINGVFSPPITVDFTGHRILNVAGNMDGVTIRGGTFDPSTAALYAFCCSYANAKFLEVTIVSGHMGIVGSMRHVYIENYDCSGIRADCLHSSALIDVEVNGVHCHGSKTDPGAHPDCFQMLPTSDTSIHDVKIRNGYVEDNTQGFDNFNSGKHFFITNLDIANVVLYIDEIQGVVFNQCNNCRYDNIVEIPRVGNRHWIHVQPSNSSQMSAMKFTGSVTNLTGKEPGSGIVPPPWKPSPQRYPVALVKP